MATVTGITVERAQEIEDASVISGAIVGSNLILTTAGGAEINAGVVVQDITAAVTNPGATRDAVDDRADIRVAAASSVAQDVSSADVTLVTNTALTGISIAADNPSTTAVYIVDLSVDLEVDDSGIGGDITATLELLVDGVANSLKATETTGESSPNYRRTVSQRWVITGLAAGTRTFTARGSQTAGTAGKFVAKQNSRLTVQRVGI